MNQEILTSIWIILNVIGIVVTITSFVNIKFNDLKHLSRDMTDLKTKIDTLDKSVNKNTTAVAQINERCKIHHKE